MKCFEDIWIEIAELASKNGIESLNFYQKHLYNFIDFNWYVLNGGGSGFLYNISTDTSGQNHHYKFTDTFRYFGFKDIASEIDNYFTDYQVLVIKWLQNQEVEFSDLLSQTKLPIIAKELDKKLEILSNDYETIDNWINENYDNLKLA